MNTTDTALINGMFARIGLLEERLDALQSGDLYERTVAALALMPPEQRRSSVFEAVERAHAQKPEMQGNVIPFSVPEAG